MFAYTEPKERLGTIQTPVPVCKWLYNLVEHTKPSWVLDPCAGELNLISPWFASKPCVAVDIECHCAEKLVPFDFKFYEIAFENTTRKHYPHRNPLVLCNAPFNRHYQKKHYPEIFLKKIVNLFGLETQIVFMAPMGFRLNQKLGSKRYGWMRDFGPKITSVISCPINMYEDTQFHSEILLFNIKKVQPHYWLSEEVINEIKNTR
jgi:hypothetical protein